MTCTYTVPTSDPDVDRKCGKPAVGMVTLPAMTIEVCRAHAEKVRRHGAKVEPLPASV